MNEGRPARREVTFRRWAVSGALSGSAAVIALTAMSAVSERVPVP